MQNKFFQTKIKTQVNFGKDHSQIKVRIVHKHPFPNDAYCTKYGQYNL